MYVEQESIGWEQVLFGRLSTKWDELSGFNSFRQGDRGYTGWTGRAVGLCWAFGLELWAVRNGIIHSTGGNPSQMKQARLQERTVALYKH